MFGDVFKFRHKDETSSELEDKIIKLEEALSKSNLEIDVLKAKLINIENILEKKCQTVKNSMVRMLREFQTQVMKH